MVVGWQPDVAVFAKGMSNGHPMAAIIGKRSVMDQAQRSFVSSTYWTDRTGPAAALATIHKMRAINAPVHLERVGRIVQQGWVEVGTARGLPVHAGGVFPLSHFHIDGANKAAIRTAFTQAMLRRGFLANWSFYATTAHTDELVNRYLEACDSAMKEIAPHVNDGSIDRYLNGPVAHSGFQRLN